MKELKPIGFIVEQLNLYPARKKKYIEKWEKFSTKLYKTKEIAIDAYNQSPYKSSIDNQRTVGKYNIRGRVIPVYRIENEKPIIIK